MQDYTFGFLNILYYLSEVPRRSVDEVIKVPAGRRKNRIGSREEGSGTRANLIFNINFTAGWIEKQLGLFCYKGPLNSSEESELRSP